MSMFTNVSPGEQNKLAQSLSLLALVGTAFLLALLVSEIRSYKFIGQGLNPTNVITVSGDGEVFATPDVANLSFSVLGKGATPAAAQEKVNQTMSKIIDSLKKAGILEKDIKTINFSSNPVYSYPDQKPCGVGMPCYYPTRSDGTITGYEVDQTTSVKIPKTEDASKILGSLAALGATNISGVTFSVDNEDEYKVEARAAAIAKAKAKAEQLAKDLDVKLVRIVSFSENGNYPIYYTKDSAVMGMGGAETAPSPVLSPGENKITSNVTITYEIR